MSNVSVSHNHLIADRIATYAYVSLVLGPVAVVVAVLTMVVETKYSTWRSSRERLSFRAVAISEILAGIAQTTSGGAWLRIIKVSDEDLQWTLEVIGESANAIYFASIIFSTSTIQQISFRRWVDVNGLRVSGVRPLSKQHWAVICVFTAICSVFVICNKIIYFQLLADKESTAVETSHTITLIALGIIWLLIFAASCFYNWRVLSIARQLHRRHAAKHRDSDSVVAISQLHSRSASIGGGRRQSLKPPNRMHTVWFRITLLIYNLASFLFVVKIADSIFLTTSKKSTTSVYPDELHIFGMVNHTLQTLTFLALPVLWLLFCTHLLADIQRRRRENERELSVAATITNHYDRKLRSSSIITEQFDKSTKETDIR